MKEILRRTTRHPRKTIKKKGRNIKKKGRTIKKKGRTTRQNCRTTRHPRRTIKKNVSKISKGGGEGSIPIVTGKLVDDEPLFGKATFTKDSDNKVNYNGKTISLGEFTETLSQGKEQEFLKKLRRVEENTGVSKGVSLIRSIIFGLQNCCFDFKNKHGESIDIDDLINKLLNKICWSHLKSNEKYIYAQGDEKEVGRYVVDDSINTPDDVYNEYKNSILKSDFISENTDCIDYDGYEKENEIRNECNKTKVSNCIEKLQGYSIDIKQIVKLLGINIVIVTYSDNDRYDHERFFLKLENNEDTPIIFIYYNREPEMFEGMYLEEGEEKQEMSSIQSNTPSNVTSVIGSLPRTSPMYFSSVSSSSAANTQSSALFEAEQVAASASHSVSASPPRTPYNSLISRNSFRNTSNTPISSLTSNKSGAAPVSERENSFEREVASHSVSASADVSPSSAFDKAAAKKLKEIQSNCQRVEEICKLGVSNLNDFNIEARQHINDDSYEELQRYINGEYSKAQKDILQTINTDLETQLQECSVNILIDERLQEIYTQISRDMKKTRDESKKIVQLAHIHPLFIKDEKDEKDENINAKFVPHDITGTNVRYKNRNKENIFLERQTPRGNWQVVIYDQGSDTVNPYLEFECQDIHPDNCKDNYNIRLKVYKIVDQKIKPYTGVTIKLFSEHLKEIREAKTKRKEVIDKLTNLMDSLKNLNNEANTEFENLKKHEDKSYFLKPLFTFFIKESKYIENFESLLRELYENYEQLMNYEDQELYNETLLSEILSNKTTIEDNYNKFNKELEKNDIKYQDIKMLKEYFDLYSKLVNHESHDFLEDIKLLVQTYKSIEEKLFIDTKIKTDQETKIIGIQKKYCNNLKTQINHLADTQINKLREITDLLKQVTLNRNSKLYTPSKEQVTKVELIKQTYNDSKTQFEGLFNEYILCTGSNIDFLPFGEEITKKEAYNMKLFEDIENINDQFYLHIWCFDILEMIIDMYKNIQNNSRIKDMEDTLLVEWQYFLNTIENTNQVKIIDVILQKVKNNIRITTDKILETINIDLQSQNPSFDNLDEKIDKLIPVYNILSKSLSEENKEKIKQIQIDYCMLLKSKIDEKMKNINKVVEDIEQKTLEEIYKIKTQVDENTKEISELFILFSRCQKGNTDKNLNFLFDEDQYEEFQKFRNEIENYIQTIDTIITNAQDNKESEESEIPLFMKSKLSNMSHRINNKKKENPLKIEDIEEIEESIN